MKTPGKIYYFKILFLICFFIIARVGFLSAQLSFQKTYNLKSETVTISQPDDQGGIVTAGNYRGEQGIDDLKVSLTNFDKNGKANWSKYYRWPGNDLRLISFILAENGDYMLAGYIIPKQDPSREQIFLIRVNKNGDIVWAKYFGNEYRSVFYSLGSSSDKGFFLYANHNDAPAGLGYNIVIKVDENGEMQWTSRYTSTWKWGTANITSDGGLVISNIDAVYKINKDGNIVWAKEFKVLSGHDIGKITELGDGGFLLIVWPSANTTGFLLKLDKNGNFVWARGYKDYDYYNFDAVLQPSGNFLLSGRGKLNAFPNQYRTFLLELNTDGEILKVIYLKNNFNIPQVVSSGDQLFISGTYNNSMHSLAKLSGLQIGSCMDTSSVKTSTPPEITGADIKVERQNISFTDLHLALVTYDLELQEDTLCYECKKPELNLGNDTILCEGGILNLNANVPTADFEWSTGEKTAAIKIENAGTYWLKVKNECGAATDTITINYKKAPEYKIKISPLVANPWDEIQFSDSTAGIKNRYWGFGDSSFFTSAKAKHVYKKNGNYEVKLLLEDSFGCSYSIVKKIKILFESLYLPNAFSPDGNGLNDTFSCIGYGIEYYRLKIYNRWGELVFDKENEGWDGKYRNAICPTGIYLYQLEVKFEENRTENRKGYVNLIR